MVSIIMQGLARHATIPVRHAALLLLVQHANQPTIELMFQVLPYANAQMDIMTTRPLLQTAQSAPHPA